MGVFRNLQSDRTFTQVMVMIFAISCYTFSRYIDTNVAVHDEVIKWKHFPRYWPFVRGIHRSQVNSPHKGQWRGALMFSLSCVWINGWVKDCLVVRLVIWDATTPIVTSKLCALGNKTIYIGCCGESANYIHVQTSFAEMIGAMDGIQYLLGSAIT